MKEKILIQKLISKNYKISAAESCTGGWFLGKLVCVPNASKVLDAGFVTYANEAKSNFVRVNPKTIENFGVVSEEIGRAHV